MKQLPNLTELHHKVIAHFNHSVHGKVEMLIWRNVDHAVIPKYHTYSYTFNDGAYGSRVGITTIEMKKLFKAVQEHETTSNFKIIEEIR